MGLYKCSNALNSREMPAVSPMTMSGSPTFDIDKKKTETGRIYNSARPYGEAE